MRESGRARGLRCLYIVSHDPLSPNYLGGASAMYYDQLMALSELGHQLHLWHFASPAERGRFNDRIAAEPDVWASVNDHCASVELSTLPPSETLAERVMARVRSVLPPRLPVARWSLRQELFRQIARTRPQLIWAQHLEPALLAAQQSEIPVVYVHHDWLFRIKALRNRRPEDREQQAVEEKLVRTVTAVVSGSYTECEEIRRAGARQVAYIPVSFEAMPPYAGSMVGSTPRLVHLGGMGTTANREGLLAFFERVWPALRMSPTDVHVIGDLSGASPKLLEHLRPVTCLGFVQDLREVLRPFDIHIIPWPHNTGQRTRLPLAFERSQVVVATHAAVACYPEARHGVNCLLVESLDQMPAAIDRLIADEAERQRLGHAARRTYEESFNRRVLLPRYRDLIGSLGIVSSM